MKNKSLIIYIAGGIGLIGGIVIGMLLQQMLFTASFVEIGHSLKGTTFNLEIDINETELVDRAYENMREFGLFDNLNETKNCSKDLTERNC